MISHYPQEPWNMSHHLSQPRQHLNSRGRGRTFQLPPGGENMSPFIDKLPNVDSQFHGPVPAVSRIVSSTIDSMSAETRSVVLPPPGGLRPPVHVPNQLHLRPALPIQNQKSQYNFINSSNIAKNHGPNKSVYTPGQLFDHVDNKELSSTKLPQLPNQIALIAPTNQPSHMQAPMPPHLVTPNLDRGYNQGRTAAVSTGLLNPVLPLPLNLATNNFPNSSLPSQGGGFPPLPPGPPPTLLQAILPPNNGGPAASSQQPGSAYSGLINSLMAQGLISLEKNPAQVCEQVSPLPF